ncbi:MAG: hypothetical protein WED09_07285 [Homoserinimonas sp.]
MIKVTAEGGALNGKRFLVHESAKALDKHPATPNGQYLVKGKKAIWTPNKTTAKTAEVEPGTTDGTKAKPTAPKGK